MSEQNWRTEVDAVDYFGHQKKKTQVADRRPVIRKASDLVGPGIAATTVRLDNLNDPLATYNGFFSADVGALNAPDLVSTTLSSSLSTAAPITSLPVAAWSGISIPSGQGVVVTGGGFSQRFFTTAVVAPGATSIPVSSVTPVFAFTAGSPVRSSQPVVGTVASDASLGGVQTFTGLTSEARYRRVFRRNPSDASTIYWGPWTV